MANTRKTAIVTGGSQGIGAGIVQAFLNRGYNVVANSRNITRSGAFEASDRLALALMNNVWPLLEAGKVRPIIHATFPIAEAVKAHELMETSTHIGKIMLKVRSE